MGSIGIGILPMLWYYFGLSTVIKNINAKYGSPYFVPPTKEDREALLEEFEQNL